MSSQTQSSKSRSSDAISEKDEEFVTFMIAEQLFGIPVLQIQDVLSSYHITPIPLAPPEITGSLNLRGRVVTAIDVRLRLGLPPRAADVESMSIVAESEGELYSLMVDSVGEVLALPRSAFERNLPTLDAKFRAFSEGIYRLEGQLLVVLDVNRLLDYERSDAA
jgi:purine-binding chemotaxis protein CheW